MAKAARVLAALKPDGWTEVQRSGSHRVLANATSSASGPTMMEWTWVARIARDYGYTLAELRKLSDW